MITWIATGIQREGYRLAKRRKRLYCHECLILNAPATADGEELINRISATCDTAAEAEDDIFLEETLSLLTWKQRIVIFETVIEGIPENVVAREFGLSQQAIHFLKVRGLRKLKTHLLNYR